jgi:thiol-disulfide isomerase/thioredoxin
MKRIAFTAILLAALFCVASCGSKKNRTPMPPVEEESVDMSKYMPSLEIGAQAPDFEAPDVLGKPVKLSDYLGHYVVLDFWATWCKDCRAEMPAVKSLYTAFSPKGVEFLGVSFDTDLESLVAYGIENQIAWMQVCNQVKWKENPISIAYDLKWIPTMFLIDPEGKVAGIAFTAEEMETILNGRSDI